MYLRKGLEINAQGHLVIGGCDSVELAREFGTPLYVYDEEYLRGRCAGFTGAIAQYAPGGAAAYAGKAFLTTAMAVLMKQCGMWLDCVSAGELYVARRAEFPAEHIILHGSNKTLAELETALSQAKLMVTNNDYFMQDGYYSTYVGRKLAQFEGKDAAVS